MAVLQGVLALSAVGGLQTPAISADLRAYTVDAWPPHVWRASAAAVGPLVRGSGVAVGGGLRDGVVGQAFSGDWYHRVHVRPNPVALGNITASQVVQVAIWNAHLVPQWLLQVDGVPDGLAVNGPAPVPLAVGALEEQTWALSVTRDGPGVVDATLAWRFASGTPASLGVTGSRAVAWAWPPTWERGVLERLEWSTSVVASRSGREQRRALRIAPRRTVEAEFVVDGTDRAAVDMALAGWGSRAWALPVWWDGQALAAAASVGAGSLSCDTAGMDWHPGGLGMLTDGAAAETVQVAEVLPEGVVLERPLQQPWQAGARLYPARMAYLQQQPEVRRMTDRTARVSTVWSVDEVCDWPAAVLPLYRGHPVVTARPDESEDLSVGWARLQLLLDNGSARPVVTDTAGVGWAAQGHRWALWGRAERAAWRALMYALRGRLRAAWVPSHSSDLDLVATAPAGGQALDVAAVGYVRFGLGRPGRSDVHIELSDGTALQRRVTGATELAGGVERLVLDLPHTVALQPAGSVGVHVMRISWLQLARLDHDQVELLHVSDGVGLARSSATWRVLSDET